MGHQAATSFPLLPLVKPHQTHLGGGQGGQEPQLSRGREDHVLLQEGRLTWVPSKAKPEVRLWVQVVYLGGDPQNESGRREREEGREGMGRRGRVQKTLGRPAPQSPPPARGLSEASSWRLAWAQAGLLAQQTCSEPPSHVLPFLTPLPLA